jgi:hypothetical protein
MTERLTDLLVKITDETSFLTFLHALIEDCERGEGSKEDLPWQTHATKDFLKSAEDWAARGDFAEGRHYGEPMLRRVATMLYSGRYRLREVRDDSDEYDR